jgi:transposase-like protein
MSGSLENVKFIFEGVEKRKPMSRYSPEFRESIVKKMMPPNAPSIASISRESGICPPTLYA